MPMSKRTNFKLLVILLVVAAMLSPLPASALDPIEAGGMGIGITLGNIVFAPAKFASVVIGLTGGAASFVLSGGNAELTQQIWRDTTQGPYLITPDLARTSVGQRPELGQKQPAAQAIPIP